MIQLFYSVILLFLQSADTLTQAYSEKWQGVQSTGGPSVLESNELIFIVLGVTLIVWFVLLGYLFKIEKQLKTLESNK
jgi:hypothetical protein